MKYHERRELKHWYQQALYGQWGDHPIDYWNFNGFLIPHKPYQLMAARTKRVLIGIGCCRVRKGRDRLWYGIIKRERGHSEETKNKEK